MNSQLSVSGKAAVAVIAFFTSYYLTHFSSINSSSLATPEYQIEYWVYALLLVFFSKGSLIFLGISRIFQTLLVITIFSVGLTHHLHGHILTGRIFLISGYIIGCMYYLYPQSIKHTISTLLLYINIGLFLERSLSRWGW